MSFQYPHIENADRVMEEKCLSGINRKYNDDLKEQAYSRAGEEIDIIRRQGSASGFLVLLNALDACKASVDEYCLRGTLGASIVIYALGMSDVDPMQCEPRLYPEFCYGLEGDRLPAFELSVTQSLHDRMEAYFANYSGEEHVERKYDSGMRPVGVYIGDIPEDYTPGEYLDMFYINFVPIEDAEMRDSLLNDEVIEACKPKTVAEYVKCYGLKHSTGAWEDNAEALLKQEQATFAEVLGNREDVYEYLLNHGVEKKMAYMITECVRKGKVARKGWDQEMDTAMAQTGIPQWFVDSCQKIQYLFPRAHAMMQYKRYRKELYRTSYDNAG